MLTYADGKCYSGEFLDGRKHGYGEEKHPNGTVISGYWRDGKLERKKNI